MKRGRRYGNEMRLSWKVVGSQRNEKDRILPIETLLKMQDLIFISPIPFFIRVRSGNSFILLWPSLNKSISLCPLEDE